MSIRRFTRPYFLLLLMLVSYGLYAQPKYEFRAVWVASVDNIDWPSDKFLPADSQKTEFINLLDLHRRNGMNAVIVQIRPATDAFYPSQYEPWSEWLTGRQGKPPAPYYDPLEFMITETHKRGMEFHAWMNPYRAEFKIGESSISPTHITRLHPEWFLPYGGIKYFDPGNKDVQAFVTNVVRDVVSRYDVDAIHFDDYFYPYRIAGKEFPDSQSFAKYGNGLDKEAWRRSNVDSIILALSKAIKEENKYIRFGISPFGVWRNKDKDPEGSETRAGQTNYDDLYADILLWLKLKWIDYVAPQLYWEFGHKLVGYEILIDWWAKHAYGRQLYIGHGFYRALEGRGGAWKDPKEIPEQIKSLRNYSTVQGSIYFSSKSFNRNPNGWNDSLRNNYYRYPALIPPMVWIPKITPAIPKISAITVNDSVVISVARPVGVQDLKGYVIYADISASVNTANAKNIILLTGVNEKISIPLSSLNNFPNAFIGVTALTKTNVESGLSNVISVR